MAVTRVVVCSLVLLVHLVLFGDSLFGGVGVGVWRASGLWWVWLSCDALLGPEGSRVRVPVVVAVCCGAGCGVVAQCMLSACSV